MRPSPRPGKGVPAPRRVPAIALTLTGFALAGLATSLPVTAQAWVPGKGHGSISVAVQQLYVKHHLDWRGNEIDAGHITANSVLLNLDYGVTERLALSVGFPYIRKKYVGNRSHDFDVFNNPGDDHDHGDHQHLEETDDGRYHGGWQDLSLRLRYNWRSEPWMITPFISFNTPARDYAYFGHAATGTRQDQLGIGVDVGRHFEPPFQNLYFQAGYGYSKVEEKLGIHADYSTLNLDLGYFLTPRWSVRALAVARKTHGGLDFPKDFPRNDDQRFLNHDRIQRVDYVELGAGASVQLDDYALYGTWLRTAWGENGHAADYAITIGISRDF